MLRSTTTTSGRRSLTTSTTRRYASLLHPSKAIVGSKLRVVTAAQRHTTPAPPLLGQRRTFHVSRAVQGKKKRATFKLADIGEGITECEVIKWSIKQGSAIQAFEPLCEVQSDKASVEITSPFDGVVHEILVKEGEIAKVGAGLCVIEHEEDGGEEDEPVPEDVPKDVAPEQPKLRCEEPATTETAARRGLHPLDPSHGSPRKLHELRIGSHPSISGRHNSMDDGTKLNVDVLAPPSIRHLAKLSGVDLARLAPGSGKDGRIEKGDLEAYLSRGTVAAQEKKVEEVGKADQIGDVTVELGRTRYNMWKAMVKSLEIPHFGYTTTLDITELHNMLPELNANIPAPFLPPSVAEERQPFAIRAGMVNPSSIYPATSHSLPLQDCQQYTKLTYLPILLKTLSKAMMQWPLLRSTIASSTTGPGTKPSLTVRPHADISLALSTPTGLYTPTLGAVDASSIYALASSLKHLSYLGRQVPSALTVKEMPKRGGTLTVSNVGAVGQGDSAHPVLVPGGGVAIVALGRAKWVWDVERGEGERRLKMSVSWSADHRVVEGAELAAFVECWRGYVERPMRLIGEGV